MNKENFFAGEYSGVFQSLDDQPHALSTPHIKIAFHESSSNSEVSGVVTLFREGTPNAEGTEVPFSGEALRLQHSYATLGFTNEQSNQGNIHGDVFVRIAPDGRGAILHGPLNVSGQKGTITAFQAFKP